MKEYPEPILRAIYELGRLYYEMGYFAPAERVFAGLASIDKGSTASDVGLGLVKLECGLYREAVSCFRKGLSDGAFAFEARIGLACAFIALGEFVRAKLVLEEVGRSNHERLTSDRDLQRFIEALECRCAESEGAVESAKALLE